MLIGLTLVQRSRHTIDTVHRIVIYYYQYIRMMYATKTKNYKRMKTTSLLYHTHMDSMKKKNSILVYLCEQKPIQLYFFVLDYKKMVYARLSDVCNIFDCN